MLSFASCLCIYSCLCTTSYDIDETFCNCVGTSLCTSGSLVFVFVVVVVFIFALYFVFVFAFVSQTPFVFVLGHWDKPVHQWVLGGASISIHILHRASHQRYLGHLHHYHHHHHIIVIINILHRVSHQGHLRNNGEMKLFSSPK